ncbi:MAG: hypothetical protein U0V73_13305 [Acidimicrobiia bacterium]
MSAGTLRIEDLRDPVLDDFQRAAIAFAAGVSLDWNPDAFLDAACARTGRSDFGDAGFRKRLEAMIDASLADDGLGPLGALVVHQRITRLLSNRLLVEDLVRRYPEILDRDHGAGGRRRAPTFGDHAPRQPARIRSAPAFAPLLGEPRTGTQSRRRPRP